eukprot:10486103-Alexandrium_andersonii.AAC.1
MRHVRHYPGTLVGSRTSPLVSPGCFVRCHFAVGVTSVVPWPTSSCLPVALHGSALAPPWPRFGHGWLVLDPGLLMPLVSLGFQMLLDSGLPCTGSPTSAP